MCRFISVVFLFTLMVSFAQGKHSLVVLLKTDSSEMVVKSLIEAKIGANFTLICKIVDTATQKYLNAHVVWSKKRKKLKVESMAEITDRMQNHIPNLLSFIRVNLKDQGTYFCTNTKYKQFKTVQIIVKSDIFPDTTEIENSDVTYPNKRLKRDDDVDELIRWIDENNDRFRDLNDRYGHKDNDLDLNFKDNNNYIDNTNTKSVNSGSAIIWCIAGVVAMIFIIYGLSRCCNSMNNDTEYNTEQNDQRQSSNHSQRTTHNLTRRQINFLRRRGSCLHRSCVLYRLNNPDTGCLFDPFDTPALNSNRGEEADLHSPLTAIIHSAEDLPTNNQNLDLPPRNLDLPPSYDVSTATSPRSSMNSLHEADDGFTTRILNSNNDNSDLPPTYEDALNNIVDSTPSHAGVTGDGGHDSGGGGGDSGDTGGGGDSGDTGGGGDSGDTGGGGGDD